MSVTNGKISPPMGKKLGVGNDGDLQLAFGVTNKSHLWFFTDAPINMWAKFKPFRHPNNAIYSGRFLDANNRAQVNSDRYQGARSVNYGLVAPTGGPYSIPADVVGKFWSYARVQSGINPASALDFEGYNHNAQGPIIPMDINAALPIGSTINYYTAFQTQGIDFSSIERGPQMDMIAIEDFADLNGWYVCLLLCNNMDYGSNRNWIWKTASSPIVLNSTSGYASSVPCPKLTNMDVRSLGNYKYYYLCVADTKYDDWSQNQPVTLFKPLPASSQLELKGFINVSSQVVSQLTILQASFTPNPTQASFADVTAYTGAGSTYYNVNRQYYVALKLRVKAPATSITIQASALKLALSTTFTGGSPHGLSLTMRNASYQSVSSLTIAANATAEFYVICAAQALAIDANGREAMPTSMGLQLTVLFTFTHNGISFSNDQFIRLTNPE